MSLRYALLALLTVEPMTGYDLFKHFESSVGYVWHAPDTQISPELRRMEKDGLLEGREVPWGPRGKKTEYSITEAGVRSFREWMNTDLEYSRERDPAHLKAAYLEWADPQAARSQMQAHLAHYTARLEQWREKIREIDEGSSPMLNKRLSGLPDTEHVKTVAFKKFTYEGLVARAQQEIAWAERGLALIAELYPSA
jgi:DNA-binding PadR family transcriptional regulator